MLSSEDNQLLTKVGPGTPLGDTMRRYWHPIALSTQVGEPDGAPLRTKLLGQPFVVFRDTQGRVGVLDEQCMHRGVSLALGRNEEGGLRCLYHGWKFAVDGTILETPNHADCRLRERLKAPAYPVREQSGLIWTYIGPAALEPPFRTFEYDTMPEEHRCSFRLNSRANWLPWWESSLDSSHVGILHTNTIRPTWNGGARGEGEGPSASWDTLAPSFEIEDTEFGWHYCAFRDLPGGEGKRNARLTSAIMPYAQIIPGVRREDRPESYTASMCSFFVPMDDDWTAVYIIKFNSAHPVSREAFAKHLGFVSPHYNPETLQFEMENDAHLGQRRDLMDSNWSGYQALLIEDAAMSVSLDPAWDRSKEHLVTSDVAVVRMRRRVLAAIRDLAEGKAPPAVGVADLSKVIGYDREINADQRWQDLAPDHQRFYGVAAE